LELGWILAPEFWRRGLMTEAARVVLRYCFSDMDIHRVEALIEPGNIASRGLVTKLGFIQEGSLLRDRICVEGRFRSVLMYSLLRPEWVRAPGRR
jgi:ribosomal-protein-alanine N-acetyltransferase